MTLPYLAGDKWRHIISGSPLRGGTLAVPALHKEVGQALGPQRLRPPAALGSVDPAGLLSLSETLLPPSGGLLRCSGSGLLPAAAQGATAFLLQADSALYSWDAGHSGHESLAWPFVERSRGWPAL